MNENTLKRNVMSELRDEESWLNFYRRLLMIRREAVIKEGSFELVESDSGYVLSYKRVLGDVTYYVLCNFAAAMQVVTLPVPIKSARVTTHTGAVKVLDDGRVSLDGYGAAVLSELAGSGNS